MINAEQLGRIYLGAYLLSEQEQTDKNDYKISVVIEQILAYCNREDIPTNMENIIAKIAAKTLTAENENANLTSYREGDTSWTWDYNPQNNLFNEVNILERFRSLGSI